MTDVTSGGWREVYEWCDVAPGRAGHGDGLQDNVRSDLVRDWSGIGRGLVGDRADLLDG